MQGPDGENPLVMTKFDPLGVPSAWVRRFAHLVPRGGSVLDVAAGGGRHTRFFRDRGHAVTALDLSLDGMADLVDRAGISLVQADLEARPWPLGAQVFDAVVVTNYLHRPLLATLVASVAPGGILIYETFAEGQAAIGRPSNPDYLLTPGELLQAVDGILSVIAYEHGLDPAPRPAARQRIAAVRGGALPRPL
jgi:SAM-dependent methyltransferase